MTDDIKKIYIISDGTGETASAMAKAAIVQFKKIEAHIVRSRNIRTEAQIIPILEDAKKNQSIVIHTLANPHLRDYVESFAKEKEVLAVDLLGPLIDALSLFTNRSGGDEFVPGLLRSVNEKYFKRVEAIEFTVKHDDGKTFAELDEADIILVGISRTSKTPLSIFLSHKGWKVANVPLVVGTPLPEDLLKVDQRKVVGLVINPENLYRIRRKRLEKYGQDPGGEYASKAYIQKEIEYAEGIFRKNRKWPVFDVTDRALEETAGEIIKIVASRMNLPFEAML